jgi:putative tryptophan/tyrosine transport system substrate-binding protein
VSSDKWIEREKDMMRKITVLALSAVFVALSVPAEAQQTGKVARIGFLDASTASGSAGLLEAFRQELRKLGWIEGKNIAIEYRFAEQKRERLPEVAAELARLKVDIIVVSGGNTAIRAAKTASSTIPIVMTTSADPVGAGFGC